IQNGDELTLDYAFFLDENMEPFKCYCGSPMCRGLITGIKNISVTNREMTKRTKRKSQSPTFPYTPSVSARRSD
ncbi:MAG TPA: hypothetical protein VET23_03545, partial [Chitinophagaceae bacterium]|nr:hypothetical protein [Chitinophagaceae bacterium]